MPIAFSLRSWSSDIFSSLPILLSSAAILAALLPSLLAGDVSLQGPEG